MLQNGTNNIELQIKNNMYWYSHWVFNKSFNENVSKTCLQYKFVFKW